MKDVISAVIWIDLFPSAAKKARGRAMLLSAWRTSLPPRPRPSSSRFRGRGACGQFPEGY